MDRGNLYNKVKEAIPENLKTELKRIRLTKSVTKVLGPRWKPNHEIVAIVPTCNCNLKCINCNQSCRQAPSNEQMSVEQIEKFIEESIDQDRRWQLIRILGGEPTLHPQIRDIVESLLSYKRKFSQSTEIHFYTNGFGREVNNVLSRLPNGIRVMNSRKTFVAQKFLTFNIAPVDIEVYRDLNYLNGCHVTTFCGIGLTRYGYYQCEMAGSIDRVFGFDLGRKELPSLTDRMFDLFEAFCKYCGYFKHDNTRLQEEMISPTWKHAYEEYTQQKPSLSLYRS
jgi:hypothetical protein